MEQDALLAKRPMVTLRHWFKISKLYWALIGLFVAGIVLSPVTSRGTNIFLSYGNLSDVLRQVSITGIVAIGMTFVVLIAGIDLSVGSMLALATVICAMLLTQPGWTAASVLALPAFAIVVATLVFAAIVYARHLRQPVHRHDAAAKSNAAPAVVAIIVGVMAMVLMLPSEDGKFGVLGVLLVVPCVGAVLGSLSGLLIVRGKLQPFVVTLAMMVSILGLARLTAGQNTAVHPVYTGSNATADFEILRATLFGFLPVPGLVFLGTLVVGWLVLHFTTFGRYVYAVGGNEQATRLAGVAISKVKITVYAVSGFLAAVAGVLYVAQYRQGKPDAGLSLELDAIAAVAIGGTSLMGGRGSVSGTFVGVLIFGLLTNILQLNNIDTNTQLLLKGAIIILAVLVQEGSLGALLPGRLMEFIKRGKTM